MSLVTRNGFPALNTLFDDIFPAQRLFSDYKSGVLTPAVDIEEHDEYYVIHSELPGINKEDIHVVLENGLLAISAEHKEESEERKEGKVIRSERRTGKFSRSFTVGKNISERDINAVFNNGVLTLTIPKLTPSEQVAKRIEIS